MAQMFEYKFTDGLQILSEDEMRELYRFPREITFLLTREEYNEALDLLEKRECIDDKLRTISNHYDLTDKDERQAFTNEFEAYKQTNEYKRVFSYIDRLEEIEETAINRYSQTFEKPEDLYDAVSDIMQKYSLTLDEEQQKKSLFINVGIPHRSALYRIALMDMDYKATGPITINPIPKPARFDTIKEETLYNTRISLERTADIQAMEIVCTRKRWSLAPLHKIIEARASALIAELDLGFESYSTNTPDKYVQPADKISGQLTTLSITGGARVMMGTKGKSKEPIHSIVRLDTQGLEGIDIKRELEPFDMDVMDAITTLFLAGNEIMTVSMIHNVLTGNSGSRITDKKRDEINDSITRLIYTAVYIDPSQEREAFYPDLKPVYDSPLVNGRRVSHVFLNGQLTEACLRVYDLPILYEYADKKNQITTVPIGLLNSPVFKNKETIVLQGYMLRRIDAMKKGNVSHTITYEAIYKLFECGSEQQGQKGPAPAKLRVKQQELREKGKAILDHFKAERWISGYTEIKKGGKLHGIEVKP